MARKGQRGTNGGRTKLLDPQVLEVFQYCERRGVGQEVQRALAEKYGVVPYTIYSIAMGLTHVRVTRAVRGAVNGQYYLGKRASSWRVLGPKER